MATGKVNPLPRFVSSKVTCPFTVTAGSAGGGNLKTLIDADMPSGGTYFCLTGFWSPYGDCIPVRVAYTNDSLSYYVRNIGSNERSGNLTVYYVYTI